jgi:sugar phosphate isomerase/epimerase
MSVSRPQQVSGCWDVDLLASCWTTAGDAGPLAGVAAETPGASEASPFALRDRIEAAARAGYRGFGVVHADLVRAAEELGHAGLRALLNDNGIVHLELEMLSDWFADGDRRSRSDRVRDDLLAAAEALGARHIKVGGEVGGVDWPLEPLIEDFRRLCERAASVGTRIALEPMPFGQIRDLRIATDIIDRAGHPAGGLVLDTWHMLRGGVDLAEIAALPKRYLFAVELDDADATPVGPPIEDTIERRRLCGEGDLDVVGFIGAVRATGYDGPWGVEILSREHRRRTLQSQVRLSYATTMWQFHLASAVDR